MTPNSAWHIVNVCESCIPWLRNHEFRFIQLSRDDVWDAVGESSVSHTQRSEISSHTPFMRMLVRRIWSGRGSGLDRYLQDIVMDRQLWIMVQNEIERRNTLVCCRHYSAGHRLTRYDSVLLPSILLDVDFAPKNAAGSRFPIYVSTLSIRFIMRSTPSVQWLWSIFSPSAACCNCRQDCDERLAVLIIGTLALYDRISLTCYGVLD